MLRDHIEKIRLLFRKDRQPYLRLYRILGFLPRNIRLYEEALLHKSSNIRSEQGRPLNNERLEFLGDAILDAIIGDIVYRHFAGKREGFLTNTRSKIVQRETLNKLAVNIGLDKLIVYSTRSSSHNSYMYGNAFEALIGAIYLDQGYDRCQEFLEKKIIGVHIDLDRLSRKEMNFKSKLIEWSQKNRIRVSFELIEQFLDCDSNPMFQTEILLEGISAGTGVGYSKKESQQQAAQMALKKIRTDQDFAEEIFSRKNTPCEQVSVEVISEELAEELLLSNEPEETILVSNIPEKQAEEPEKEEEIENTQEALQPIQTIQSESAL